MNDENRGPERRRREERQREEAERQRRERAENDTSFHEGLGSGDRSRWLARRDYVVDAEVARAANVDEASALAGQFDKQVWQQEALETVYEAQQSLWASILRLTSGHNSAAETAFLSSLLTVTTISADDENTLSTIDGQIRSSEVNDRFSDLTRELRLLRSKVEEYRLVREIVKKGDD